MDCVATICSTIRHNFRRARLNRTNEFRVELVAFSSRSRHYLWLLFLYDLGTAWQVRKCGLDYHPTFLREYDVAHILLCHLLRLNIRGSYFGYDFSF